MVKPSICIVQFPGVNCEYETAWAIGKVGMDASILRWNQPLSEFRRFDGFVLPGGFAYEDRVRAGAIAAADEVSELIAEEASLGKPVFGVCNGAQVLVEAGLVPGFVVGQVEMALAPNRGMGRGGYYSNWVLVTVSCDPERCAATYGLEPGEILPIPVAHAQGRFVSSDPDLLDRLESGGQVVFKYCREDGRPAVEFPHNPNGSERMAAAICNDRGNVVAMMPHPERATWLRQVPHGLWSDWSDRRMKEQGSASGLDRDGPGARIFRSIARYIEEQC